MALLPYEFIVNPPYSNFPLVVIKSTESMWTFSGLTNFNLMSIPVAPTGTASTTGGTIAAGNNYARIVAINAIGQNIGSESINVPTTGATSSIAWTWTAVTGATSYQIWCGTTAGTENYYFTSATNSFTQTAPATSGTAGTAGMLLSGIGPTPLAPSGTPVGSGGILLAGNNYARITAIDSNGFITNASPESLVVVTSVNNSSINWTWPAIPGAVYYQVWVSTSSGTEGTYFLTNTNSFTQVYQVGTTATIPTTNGKITRVLNANYPASTVPGVCFLDGAFYVMTPQGKIFGSALEDPTTWTSLNSITAEGGSGIPIALHRHLNFILAFTDQTTQAFYDANNPAPGSPLSPSGNMLFEVGCASAYSIASIDDVTIFISKTKQRGRAVHMISGMSLNKISTEAIDKILNLDNLSTVYSYGIRTNGHDLYILTLANTNKTIVYDLITQQWHTWTSTGLSTSQTVGSLVFANGVVTGTLTGHGFSDGDPVVIAGANQQEYNGTFNITVIDVNTFSYTITGSPTTPATGTITATGYTETFFDGSYYTDGHTVDLMQDAADGRVYGFLPNIYTDQDGYINTLVRTGIHDANTTERKNISRLEVVGDKVASNLLVRYSDDDYTTFAKYRPVDLSARRSILARLGSPARRSFDFRHTANTAFRAEAVELDVDN